MSNYAIFIDENGSPYLAHYGIKGQRQGVRRYQNPDGTLTPEGRQHYGIGDPRVRSASGNARRALAGVYGVNAKTYGKLGNKALSSMNASARNRQLKKAEEADNRKRQKISDAQASRIEKKLNKKSIRGNARRILAGIYGLNEKTYERIGNKTLASMNASARKQQLSKAEEADERRREELDRRLTRGRK